MRNLVAILLCSVVFSGVAIAQEQVKTQTVRAQPGAAVRAPDGLQPTQLQCIVTDDGQAIVLQKAPDGVKAKPVFVKAPPKFDPYKQKLSKFNDRAEKDRCIREPQLAEMTDDEQRDYLKGQFDQWFGPAAALLLNQQNQIRALQKLPPITMDQLMAEVQKLPRKE